MERLKCEKCGYDSFKGYSNITIVSRNSSAKCPHCGHRTKIKDGSYAIDRSGVIKYLEQIPKDDLAKLRIAAIGIRDQDGTAKDFQAAVSDINPAYSSFFSQIIELSKDENFRYWIDRLIKLIAIVLGGAAIGNINLNTQITNVGGNVGPAPETTFSKSYEQQLRIKNLKTIKFNKEKQDSTKATRRR